MKPGDGQVKFAVLMLFFLGLGACTRELDYKTVFKEQVISKSLIDTSAEYLYVPSTGAASRTVTGQGGPYFLGEEKIVKLELTRDALQAYTVEMDANYQGNPQNRKLVFEIPISHVEYHCQTDRLGNCRNQEEENNLITWDKKSQIKPDFSRLNVTEANFLPESINKLIVGRACMTEVSSKPLDYEFVEDHINFRIERVMANDVRCTSGWFVYLSDLTASIVSNYSLVKLNSISTEGYKSLDYPRVDEETFGFFQTERNYTDVDYTPREAQQLRLLNHWNPNRSEIVYHLSDEFNKPEYASLKKAAYRTIERMNDGLEAAGVRFRLHLKDPSGINTADMRYSMIVLVEDPVGGLLGYGPSVTHPRTGEILAARTIMYPGTLKQQARGMYDEIREQREKDAAASKTVERAKISEVSGGGSDSSKAPSGKFVSGLLSPAAPAAKTSGVFLKNSQGFGSELKKMLEPKNYRHAGTVDPIDEQEPVDLFMARRHSCLFRLQSGLEMVGSEVNPEIMEAFNKKFGTGALKKWEDLEADEKQFVLDLVVPEAFSGVLIHEMGHNLGLRHNFRGSEDKRNFYTKEELAEKGINRMVQSSSVMEYGASPGLRELPIFGKYDIAALRFGYQRQVMKTDGSALQVKGTLKEEIEAAKGGDLGLKEFKYCTDESADLNPKCRRFDTGATYTEIVEGVIKRYNEIVDRVAYRRKRATFSTLDSIHYAAYIARVFSSLRAPMELAERIKYRLGISYDDPTWQEDVELADLRQAVVKAGRFFNTVLSAPDHTCFYQVMRSGVEVIIPLLLTEVNRMTRSFNLSCPREKALIPEMPERILLVGEVGRYFQDQKNSASEDPRVPEIDVRGSWIDKTLAAKYLFARRRIKEMRYEYIDLLDKYTDNFMDFPELVGDLDKTIDLYMKSGFLKHQARDFEVTSLKGDKKNVTVSYGILRSFNIPQQLYPFLPRYLGIPADREVNFIEVFGQQLARQGVDSGHGSLAEKTANRVGIYKTSAALGGVFLPAEALSFSTNGVQYAATKENDVAYEYLSYVIPSQFVLNIVELVEASGGAMTYGGICTPVRKVRVDKADPKEVLPAPLPIQKAMLNLDEESYKTVDRVCGVFGLLKDEGIKQAKAEIKIGVENIQRALEMLPVLNKQ